MTGYNARNLLYHCIENMYNNQKNNEVAENINDDVFSIYSEAKNEAQLKRCVDQVYWIYNTEFTNGCAKDVGYILSVDSYVDTHPINIFATIYALLVVDADIYILYDASFSSKGGKREIIHVFLEEFLRICSKARKINIPEEMKYSDHIVIKRLAKSKLNIKHLVIFGDFVNFHRGAYLFKDMGLRIHLPAAHYLIMNYSKEHISPRDEQVLISFGHKCMKGYVDYAGYQSKDNQCCENYGFSLCSLFENDLTMFYALEEIKPLVDKVTTVVFTDKTKEELNYPEELYDVCNVIFSKNFNDNVINYDYNQLFN